MPTMGSALAGTGTAEDSTDAYEAVASEAQGFFASMGGFLRKSTKTTPPVENIVPTARGPKRYDSGRHIFSFSVFF